MAQQWAGATIAAALLAINPGRNTPEFCDIQPAGDIPVAACLLPMRSDCGAVASINPR